MQELVYKLVPGLQAAEEERRNAYAQSTSGTCVIKKEPEVSSALVSLSLKLNVDILCVWLWSSFLLIFFVVQALLNAFYFVETGFLANICRFY